MSEEIACRNQGDKDVNALCYHDGQCVQLGDVVDVGAGSGPLCRVVVIIPTGEAAPHFKSEDWKYLERGVMLQDTVVFGLLHVEELDHETVLVRRGQQAPAAGLQRE